jgi:hypothetical protein
MLLSKQALLVHKLATQDDPRYGLNGIRVEPDGSTVATDGHKLIKYTPKHTPDAVEFPTIEGCNPVQPRNDDGSAIELEPFILPSDAAAAAIKALPGKRSQNSLPILAYVALDVAETNRNGQATLATTDLENPVVMRPAKLDGAFPKYENVIPKTSELDEPIGFDVAYMMQICQTLKAQGFRHASLQLARPFDPSKDDNKYKVSDRPMAIKATNDDGQSFVLLMPCHLS